MWRIILVLCEVIFLVLPVSWVLTQMFAIKVIRPADYKLMMRSTARMEMEVYGFVVSSSVEWWLKDNNVAICKVHPSLLYGRHSHMVGGGIVYCECPPNYTDVLRHYSEQRIPPAGRGSASFKKRPCNSSCDINDLIGDSGVVGAFCSTHGRRVPPNPGMPSRPRRPNPTRAERR